MTGPAPLWPRTVSAALLGTATRPVGTDGADPVLAAHLDALPPDTTPAELVLHVAALTAVAIGASGPEPITGLAPVPVAPPDPRPELSPRLTATVRESLFLPGADRWCLTPIADAGLRGPAALLPALLRYTADHPEAGSAVSLLAGPKGTWLAGLAPRLGARLHASDGAVPAVAEWDALRAPERARAIEGLGPVVAGGDAEALCERGLDDRTATVRAAAQRALSGTVGTAYEARTRARAESIVRRARSLLGGLRLEVEYPAQPDATALRDGLTWPPPQGVSAGAHWVDRLTTDLPLAAWEQLLGTAPEKLLDAAGEFRDEFRRGWRARASRERDPRWAAALARSGEPEDLALLPGPWPDDVCARVLRAFGRALADDDWRPPPPALAALIEAAAVALPIGPRSPWAHRTSVLIAQGTTARARYFAHLNDVLRLRTVIHEELPQ